MTRLRSTSLIVVTRQPISVGCLVSVGDLGFGGSPVLRREGIARISGLFDN